MYLYVGMFYLGLCFTIDWSESEWYKDSGDTVACSGHFGVMPHPITAMIYIKACKVRKRIKEVLFEKLQF